MFDGVVILGKELRRDPERARRELRARAAASSIALRRGASRVISLEAPLRGQQQAGSAIVAEYLDQLGVPRERQVLLQVSRSTRDEAIIGCRIAQARGWARLLVLTSAYHVPRARRLFEEQCGAGAVAVHPPEALLRHARPLERDWILAGAPDARAMSHEKRVEAVLSALERAIWPIPGGLRVEAEMIAGALFRRVGSGDTAG